MRRAAFAVNRQQAPQQAPVQQQQPQPAQPLPFNPVDLDRQQPAQGGGPSWDRKYGGQGATFGEDEVPF